MPSVPEVGDYNSYPYSLTTGPAIARGNGVVLALSEVKLAQITDGTTQTILIGEKHIPQGEYDTGTFPGNDQGWDLGFDTDINRWTKHTPLSDTANFPTNVTDEDRLALFGSAHAAGCQFVFCDGSVHTLAYGIDADTFFALGSVADGEIVDESEL